MYKQNPNKQTNNNNKQTQKKKEEEDRIRGVPGEFYGNSKDAQQRQRVSSHILISGCFGCVLSTTLPGLNQELDSPYVVPTKRKPSACI